MKRINIVIIIGALFATFLNFGCVKKPKAIEMGLTGIPDILDIPYFIAVEKGFYKEEGVDVRYTFIQGDAVAIQALLSKSFDIVSSGHFAVIHAVNRGAHIKAFVSILNSHDYILSSTEKIKSMENLRGKTIAIYAPGDITEIVTRGILKKFGINSKEVNWLSIGGSTDRYRAVLMGKADAAPLHIDFAYKLEKESGFHTLISIAKEQPLPMSVVSATEEFIKEKPEILLGITKALIKACRYAVENKKEFVDIAFKYLEEMEREEISLLYDQLLKQEIYGVNGGITEQSIRNGVDMLVEIGTIEYPIPPSKIANFQFIEKVCNEFGQYEAKVEGKEN